MDAQGFIVDVFEMLSQKPEMVTTFEKLQPKSAVQLISCTCLQSFCCTKVSRRSRANNFTTYTQDSVATCQVPTRNAIWLLSTPDSCPAVMWENDTWPGPKLSRDHADNLDDYQ